MRKDLRNLENQRRKLNTAIQEANFKNRLDIKSEKISISEALELRKALNEQIGELHSQVVASAYERVIYKEGRDIVEKNDVSYSQSTASLNKARLDFRELNRKLRAISFEAEVDFYDE